MKKILEQSLFWPIFVIITLAVFAFFAGASRTYKSYVDVLIVAKSETSAQNIDQIVSSARKITGTLSFLNTVSEKTGGIFDQNGKIDAERLNGSNILRLTVFDKNASIAEMLSRESALALAQNLAKYYNIKTDLDVQLIDGPITARATRWGFFTLLATSLIVGFIFSFGACGVFSKYGEIFAKRPVFSLEEISKRFPREKFEKKAEDTVKTKETKIEKTKKVVESKVSVTPKPEAVSYVPTKRKAPAPENLPGTPDNLPVADLTLIQSLLGKKETVESKIEDAKKKAEKDIADREPSQEEVLRVLNKLQGKNNRVKPTPEEAKERLNKLLNGEFE